MGSRISPPQFLGEQLKSRSVARCQNEGVPASRQPLADGNADAASCPRYKDRLLCCRHLPSSTIAEIVPATLLCLGQRQVPWRRQMRFPSALVVTHASPRNNVTNADHSNLTVERVGRLEPLLPTQRANHEDPLRAKAWNVGNGSIKLVG